MKFKRRQLATKATQPGFKHKLVKREVKPKHDPNFTNHQRAVNRANARQLEKQNKRSVQSVVKAAN